jgi:hypothetical protein
MLMGVRALIMIQQTGGVEVAKQATACLDYIKHQGHELGGYLRAGSQPVDAAKSVMAGEAQVIVAAYRVRNSELTGEIEAAGGRVEYVHREQRGPMTARSILASLYRRLGWSAHKIATEVGGNTEDVLDHLRRAGIKKPRRHE